MSIISQALDVAYNPDHMSWITPVLLIADAALCGVIIDKVPYTEIDWKTYMEQIAIYLKGERDYKKIEGSTGPLVYPGAHVWIYKQLYKYTDEGRNIDFAQYILRLFISSLLLPSFNVIVELSIFMLRCFNDCFAVLGLWVAIYCYQRNQWHIGSFFYSTAFNVKMIALLPIPAIGILMVQKTGGREALTQAMIIFQVSILWGYPFRRASLSYFPQAFDFGRAFLYKWTVNWRFVPESIFLSRPFSLGLLAVHIGLLLWFARTRWTKPSKRNFRQFLKIAIPAAEPRDQDTMARKITPDFIMTCILSATTIGMLCARSLHYQFYAYIAWATPFLLWKSGLHPIAQYALWGAQEWAWNVYPSTSVSSATVVGVMAATVAGVYWGTRNEYEGATKGIIDDDADEHEHKE